MDKFIVKPLAHEASGPLDIYHSATKLLDVTPHGGLLTTKTTVLVPNDLPAYPIGVAAQIMGVHPRTLRLYEAAGLIQPRRRGIQRLFSNNDLRWILCIRRLIHDEGIGIPGIRRLLELAPCWEVIHCPAEVHLACSAYRDRGIPCWELTQRACTKGPEQCRKCDVYLKAQEVARIPRRSRRRTAPAVVEVPKT